MKDEIGSHVLLNNYGGQSMGQAPFQAPEETELLYPSSERPTNFDPFPPPEKLEKIMWRTQKQRLRCDPYPSDALSLSVPLHLSSPSLSPPAKDSSFIVLSSDLDHDLDPSSLSLLDSCLTDPLTPPYPFDSPETELEALDDDDDPHPLPLFK